MYSMDLIQTSTEFAKSCSVAGCGCNTVDNEIVSTNCCRNVIPTNSIIQYPDNHNAALPAYDSHYKSPHCVTNTSCSFPSTINAFFEFLGCLGTERMKSCSCISIYSPESERPTDQHTRYSKIPLYTKYKHIHRATGNLKKTVGGHSNANLVTELQIHHTARQSPQMLKNDQYSSQHLTSSTGSTTDSSSEDGPLINGTYNQPFSFKNEPSDTVLFDNEKEDNSSSFLNELSHLSNDNLKCTSSIISTPNLSYNTTDSESQKFKKQHRYHTSIIIDKKNDLSYSQLLPPTILGHLPSHFPWEAATEFPPNPSQRIKREKKWRAAIKSQGQWRHADSFLNDLTSRLHRRQHTSPASFINEQNIKPKGQLYSVSQSKCDPFGPTPEPPSAFYLRRAYVHTLTKQQEEHLQEISLDTDRPLSDLLMTEIQN